ncbi:hypothetical protein GGTG_07390 [Gaeumannomyces tritici R3-111a-1]|uniref:Uncharacterized protein n=1 Tax=Gaeumannomyces tritici (strain R3-111a-1) TaxID=644352 RepID=J3P1J2_GAET3|nr:hypothetical protein GGTG_07390 [Gaeumannomyces tritici R3-111a-1]EJT73534.1 hypothetical protein GGTG_07390 [Gaeumannomyces tritici R3-111a-1]
MAPIGFYIRSRFLNWSKPKSRKIISKFSAGSLVNNSRKKNYKHGIRYLLLRVVFQQPFGSISCTTCMRIMAREINFNKIYI